MSKKFDYQGAKEAGYSDEEITQHLSEKYPKFDIQSATESGYSPQEINEHLSSYKPKKSTLEKAGRLATQVGLGLAENVALPLELPQNIITGVGKSETGNAAISKQNAMDMIEFLSESHVGKPVEEWDPDAQQLYKNMEDVLNAKPEDLTHLTPDINGITTREIAEKVTGTDLHPEGVAEKAANWFGFIKNPTKIKELFKMGIKPKNLLKAVFPVGDALRGVGAGAALQIAEENEFGPIGTIAAAVIGDLAGHTVSGTAKAIANPKQSLANLASKFPKAEKLELQKQIIQDFRDAGLQADIGTLTDSNLVKMIQAKLSQSGLTGEGLESLRKQLTSDVRKEYGKIADELGNQKFSTIQEAADFGKETVAKIRDAEKSRIDKIYESSRIVGEEAKVSSFKLAEAVSNLERKLAPGAIKSTEQRAVLDIVEKLKNDFLEPDGRIKPAKVQDLINNKIALNDIINYEVQGGQKQLLKNLVAEMDKAIISHGKDNPAFAKNYKKANEEFSKYAKTFRNNNLNKILTSQDSQILMNKMNSVQGMRDLEKAFNITAEGKEAFKDLKRFKLDQMIGKKMTDNVSEQLKTGTFANLLKNPKDAQIVKEMLGPQAFAKLAKLQKSVGKLAETAQKFFNASKSGVTILDAGLVGKLFVDLGMALSGNPWPALKTGGGLVGARYLTKLMSDPKFLKMVEEAILASSKEDISKLMYIGKQMEEPIKSAMSQTTKD